MRTFIVCLSLAGALLSSVIQAADQADAKLPTLWIIGDSTVRNHTPGQVGWGDPIAELFDPAKINVQNRALGGRSSRTFFTEGLWNKVLSEIKPGDFVLMQFGHNDGGPLTGPKARASIKGTGDQTQDVTEAKTGKSETVHTYGWYLKRYVTDAKTKGATPIVLSPIPRNIWKDGKVARASNDYGKWARDIAAAESVPFIDLNEIIASHYEAAGQSKVASEYFGPTDHTHTTAAGAKLNAECVVEGIRALKDCPLKDDLRPAAK
jgi:lysophospholipase L1-like esterase